MIIVKSPACGNCYMSKEYLDLGFTVDSENEISYINRSSGYLKEWYLTNNKDYQYESYGTAKGYYFNNYQNNDFLINKFSQEPELY